VWGGQVQYIYLLLQVSGLNEGKEYQFRVKAVNAEGESEPLETDIPTLAKNPYCEFQIISVTPDFLISSFSKNSLLLWYRNVYYHIHRGLPLVHIVGWMNQLHTPTYV
jgi:hypothetical protein